jgi:hypothetical protein
MKLKITRLLSVAIHAIGLGMMLSACAPQNGLTKEETTGVGVRSLNYSGKEVEYIQVEKPDLSGHGGGGDSLNPYSGGGSTICCFSIPDKWRPDLKVLVVYRFYPEKEEHRQLVTVPPYAGGKAGAIWLIVHADESAEAVVSSADPDHPAWPGKIKGYPVPSKEYRLKIWERQVAQTKDDLAGSEESLKKLSKETILERWNYQKKYEESSNERKLQSFTGPDDPKYAASLKNEYEKQVKFFSTRLEYLLKTKP